MKKEIYLILAAMMLLCLAPMPYGYFMIVRLVAMIVFGLMAYKFYVSQKMPAAYLFGILALLFQPIYKIALGRVVWNVIDVIVAIILIGIFILEWKNEKKTAISFEPLPPQDWIKSDDNKISFLLQGKLSPKELVYTASIEDKALNDLFENRPEVLEGWGKMIGFHVIYLPALIRKLKDRKVLQYRAPYLNDEELAHVTVGNDFMLQYLDNPSDKQKITHGFIRTEDIHRGNDGKDKASNRFYPLCSNCHEPLADQLHRIGKKISFEQHERDKYLECYDDLGDDASPYVPSEEGFISQIGEESIDDLMEEVRERIEKLRQRGIAEYLLEQLIHPDNRLSRLVITKDYRILLPDYHNMEIKMEPLVKAVYLLFLNHPEGIVFKSLPDYRQELVQIYSHLRPS